MANRCYKFYSVYDRETDLPIIIHATSKAIREQPGITDQTFRTYASHTKNGTRSDKYLIYADDSDDEDGAE